MSIVVIRFFLAADDLCKQNIQIGEKNIRRVFIPMYSFLKKMLENLS